MEWNTLDGYIIKEHPGQVAMSLWDTLYRWLCHHETPYVDWYIIKKRPMQVLMPLWDTLYRWLCHHGTPLDVDGYIINENSKGPKFQTLGSKDPNEAIRAQIQNGNESQQNNVGRDKLFPEFSLNVY